MAEKIPKVRPDAVVPNLASIDGDSQGVRILLRELPLQSEIDPEHRCPSRMMLLVEGHLASPIRPVHRSRACRPRPATNVHNMRGRRKEDVPSQRAYRGAEVHILRVEKVPLVEQAGRFSVRASHEQAGATDPIDELFTAGFAFDPPRDRLDTATVQGER